MQILEDGLFLMYSRVFRHPSKKFRASAVRQVQSFQSIFSSSEAHGEAAGI